MKFVIQTLVLAVILVSSQAHAAREKALLNQALESSMSERAGVARNFKGSDSSARNPDRDSLRAMSVEVGDELGAQGGSREIVLGNDDAGRGYREKGSTKNLDREWKEVNKSFKRLEAPKL